MLSPIIAEEASGLTITIGQFLTILCTLVGAGCFIVSFLFKNQTKINDLEVRMALSENSAKNISVDQTEIKGKLSEIIITLGALNISIATLTERTSNQKRTNNQQHES